jgi:hypothetical protein
MLSNEDRKRKVFVTGPTSNLCKSDSVPTLFIFNVGNTFNNLKKENVKGQPENATQCRAQA